MTGPRKRPPATAGPTSTLPQSGSVAAERLLALKRELARVQRALRAARGTRLVRVNSRLVEAALRAQEIAEGAHEELHRFRSASEQAQHDLREANGQLVLSGLAAQQLESASAAAHRRHVQFLATVAHELRNPLSPIRTAADLLGRAGKDPEMLSRLQGVIQRQVRQMARLVEDLLDAARSDEGVFRIDRQALDVVAPLQQALEAARPAIDRRGQQLQVDIPGEPIDVLGDHARLTQVFSNLLDNASKYTPVGGRIVLTLLADPANATVTVADSGIGISGEALPHVFDMFVQESRAAEHDRGGLGIGLSVVRSLVRAHGGHITVRSEGVHLGSEFVVTLPRHVSAAPATPGLSAQQAAVS